MKIIQIIIGLLFVVATVSCTAEANKKESDVSIQQADQVEVYYFHNSRRCATCKTVENVSKTAVETLQNEKVTFIALNLESEEGEKKADELEISGQSLLIVGGNQKINLTQEGFLHARSNPDKLKQLIQEKIQGLL